MHPHYTLDAIVEAWISHTTKTDFNDGDIETASRHQTLCEVKHTSKAGNDYSRRSVRNSTRKKKVPLRRNPRLAHHPRQHGRDQVCPPMLESLALDLKKIADGR